MGSCASGSDVHRLMPSRTLDRKPSPGCTRNRTDPRSLSSSRVSVRFRIGRIRIIERRIMPGGWVKRRIAARLDRLPLSFGIRAGPCFGGTCAHCRCRSGPRRSDRPDTAHGTAACRVGLRCSAWRRTYNSQPSPEIGIRAPPRKLKLLDADSDCQPSPSGRATISQ